MEGYSRKTCRGNEWDVGWSWTVLVQNKMNHLVAVSTYGEKERWIQRDAVLFFMMVFSPCKFHQVCCSHRTPYLGDTSPFRFSCSERSTTPFRTSRPFWGAWRSVFGQVEIWPTLMLDPNVVWIQWMSMRFEEYCCMQLLLIPRTLQNRQF